MLDEKYQLEILLSVQILLVRGLIVLHQSHEVAEEDDNGYFPDGRDVD